MPNAPKRYCLEPRCPNLVPPGTKGRCPAHASQHERYRGSNTSRGYGSDWKRTRDAFLARPEHVLCVLDCKTEGRVTIATEVDHKVPFNGLDDPLRLDWSNLQPACGTCHRRKQANYYHTLRRQGERWR